MSHPQPAPPGRDPRKRARLVWAGVFVAVGVALCAWSWQHYRKVYNVPKSPVPVMDFIPVIPKERHAAVTTAILAAASLTLSLSPEQQRQVRAIWTPPPRTLQELIEKQKQMDRILTPAQLARFKPVRKMVQDKIVDEMFESGRGRFTPDEFRKFKDEIKRRVEQRMTGS